MAALSRILVACSLAVFAKFATAQQSDVSGADGDVSAQHDGHDHGDVHEELVLPHGIVMLISGYGLIAAILIAILNHLKPTGGIFESFDKDRWHLLAKVHRYLAFSSFIGMVVGLLLITQDGLLFVEGHGPLEYIHGSMGVALVLAALFQVHIGYTYRKFYRTSLFMRDAHRWMGRILGAILVLWQLPSGALSLWGDAPVVAGLLWTVVPISLGAFLWYVFARASPAYSDIDSDKVMSGDLKLSPDSSDTSSFDSDELEKGGGGKGKGGASSSLNGDGGSKGGVTPMKSVLSQDKGGSDYVRIGG